MIRSISAALAVAAGAFAAIGVAAPALALDNGDKIIDQGEVVVWNATGNTGDLYDFSTLRSAYPTGTALATSFGTSGTGTPINDNTSSIVNYSADYVRAYADTSFMGTYIQLLPYGQTNGTLSYSYGTLGTLDNKLSSHKVAGP